MPHFRKQINRVFIGTQVESLAIISVCERKMEARKRSQKTIPRMFVYRHAQPISVSPWRDFFFGEEL